jgi:cytochrome c oxidase subunit 4
MSTETQADTEHKVKKNIRPFSTYIVVWLGLLALTGLTITVSGLNLGQLSVLGAILIAVVKSSLVVLFFMNIKYEDKIFKIMLAVAILTLMVIMLLTFADTSFR